MPRRTRSASTRVRGRRGGAPASYTWTGLTASTAYTFQHRVIDAPGNTTEGTAVTDTTDAPPVAGTYAWERQAAMVSSNSSLSLHLPVAGTAASLLSPAWLSTRTRGLFLSAQDGTW